MQNVRALTCGASMCVRPACVYLCVFTQDLRTVFRVVVDGEFSEGSEGSHTLTLLWDVLTAWPTDKRLQFVDFVTGSKRLPLPGSELLKIECPFLALNAAQKAAMLQTLPQAHTCDNLLELPNYWGALLEVSVTIVCPKLTYGASLFESSVPACLALSTATGRCALLEVSVTIVWPGLL